VALGPERLLSGDERLQARADPRGVAAGYPLRIAAAVSAVDVAFDNADHAGTGAWPLRRRQDGSASDQAELALSPIARYPAISGASELYERAGMCPRGCGGCCGMSRRSIACRSSFS
jgi:hypothetical protein